MKTVVLGLFDDLDTARRVLNQLAASPLDLDQISVVHGDLDTQRGLARDAGLPAHRGPMAGVVAGALIGAALGYYAGTALAPEAVGWLLALALGAVIGALVGGALGAISETVRVPKVHQAEVLQAIGEGATALVVRSDSLPTARAVGDLFRVAGSRELSPLGPPAPQTDAEDPAAAAAAVEAEEGVIAEPLGESFAGAATAAETAQFAQFAPPVESDRAPAAAGPTTAPQAAGETIFAPPRRRGVVDPADVAPAPSPTPTPSPSASASAAVVAPPAAPSSSFAPPADAVSIQASNTAPTADGARAMDAAATDTTSTDAASTDAAATDTAATASTVDSSVATGPPTSSSQLPAPVIAGRTATQRIARLLLDAIDEAEGPAATTAPSTVPATSTTPATKRTPRKRAT